MEAPKAIKERTIRTNNLAEAVKMRVEAKEGKTNLSGFSREFAVSRRTMWRVIKEDLNVHVYKRTLKQALETTDTG